MKKVVLTFGLLSGGIPITVMVLGLLFGGSHGMGSLILGWTVIILSSLFIFFGIKSYRDNYNNGIITFGKAFQVGILITLISALMYTLVWEILYFNFMNDMMDGYFAAEADKLKASGASQAEIQGTLDMAIKYKTNPLYNAAFTILEPTTITIPMTLIASLIMKRKTKKEAVA
ncbi:MAG TPA: DUF4199 domain-containing protein [Bacteroidia bacterium]|jgi:hypothetical protein|nr:DUF4199 domain-containing protein [Bacteroidia bacterium]